MLRAIAFLSFVYDFAAGLALFFAAEHTASVLNVPAPHPPVIGDINGLLLMAIGVGYLLPARDPVKWRMYLWLMGPILKGLGALVFVRAVFAGSPVVFLLLAASDAGLATITFLALWRSHPRDPSPALPPPDDGRKNTTGVPPQ